MSHTVKRSFDVRFSDIGGQRVVVKRNQAFELNEVAFEIWKRCDGKNTPEAIAKMLFEMFDAPETEVQADCAALIEEMLSKGFLTRVDA